MQNLRAIHFIVGILGFIGFVLTGQHMALAHGHFSDLADMPRMMYRSAHIYGLFAALLNLALAAYFRPAAGITAKRLQLAGSLIILLVPLLLQYSFYVESPGGSRPIGQTGIYLSLVGIALHVLAAIGNRES